MTTKKQRREQVAARRAQYDAETRRMGLEAQKRDREKRDRVRRDADRVEKSKANAIRMRKLVDGNSGIDLTREESA